MALPLGELAAKPSERVIALKLILSIIISHRTKTLSVPSGHLPQRGRHSYSIEEFRDRDIAI